MVHHTASVMAVHHGHSTRMTWRRSTTISHHVLLHLLGSNANTGSRLLLSSWLIFRSRGRMLLGRRITNIATCTIRVDFRRIITGTLICILFLLFLLNIPFFCFLSFFFYFLLFYFLFLYLFFLFSLDFLRSRLFLCFH